MWVEETKEVGLYKGKDEVSPDKNTKMKISKRMSGNPNNSS